MAKLKSFLHSGTLFISLLSFLFRKLVEQAFADVFFVLMIFNHLFVHASKLLHGLLREHIPSLFEADLTELGSSFVGFFPLGLS